MSNFLITGDRGFIGSYIVSQLLDDGHYVVGIDNNSKYGAQKKSFDTHHNYFHYDFDVRDQETLQHILSRYDVEYFIMGAALIGGISYFNTYPYTLLSANEQIMASQYGAAIHHNQYTGRLKRAVVISSSMVYESTKVFPTPEGAQLTSPPPMSSYGFQKLACEYWARAAFDEFGVPFTIVRPFNCVGVGEVRALAATVQDSGGITLAMSHVVPDLIQKLEHGQDPLRILGSGSQMRCYTSGKDIARGIEIAALSPAAHNEDFNISVAQPHTVSQVAQKIWDYFYPGEAMRIVHDPPLRHDVQNRVPDVSKARRLLGFEATETLDDVLEVVVPWVRNAVKRGVI